MNFFSGNGSRYAKIYSKDFILFFKFLFLFCFFIFSVFIFPFDYFWLSYVKVNSNALQWKLDYIWKRADFSQYLLFA